MRKIYKYALDLISSTMIYMQNAMGHSLHRDNASVCACRAKNDRSIILKLTKISISNLGGLPSTKRYKMMETFRLTPLSSADFH